MTKRKSVNIRFLNEIDTKLLTNSSEESGQSGSPSHFHLCVIHVPSPHLKSSSLHLCFGQCSSSLPSPQSFRKMVERKEKKHERRMINEQTIGNSFMLSHRYYLYTYHHHHHNANETINPAATLKKAIRK